MRVPGREQDANPVEDYRSARLDNPAAGLAGNGRKKEPKVLVRIMGQAPLAATVYSLSGCDAARAGRCLRRKSRKAWARKSTTRPPRR